MVNQHKHRRRLFVVRPDERGQSALIAVVGLIVLAIGMYTSYNLSRAVYEKIKLQNTADAAAYSLATLEARTFNFVAFSNRAQAANYAMMMEAQSILSNATYLEGMFGWVSDVMITAGSTLEFYGTLFGWLPGLGWMKPTGRGIRQAGESMYNAMFVPAREVVQRWEDMRVTKNYITYKTWKNKALFAVTAMMVLATLGQLAEGGQPIIRANDEEARLTWLSYALNGVNMISYGTAFDSSSFTGGDEEAQRLMTEISNASRFGTAAGADFVVSREAAQILMGFLGAEPLTTMEDAVNNNWKGKGGGLKDKLNKTISFILGPKYVGTTKMMSAGDSGQLPELDETKQQGADKSFLSKGDVILAKDQTRFFKHIEDTGFASVVSGTEKAQHCRYEEPNDFGEHHAGIRIIRIFADGDYAGFKCDPGDEDNHLWPGGGISQYVKFAPKVSGFSAERKSFNQPDVWVFLNKRPSNMALTSGVGDLDFEISNASDSAELDARIGENAVLFDGMNVMARAQVYYHRPGAWREPPNFFNPYWGARLAPKNVAVKRLMTEVGLGGTLSQLLSDNILMH